MPLYQPQGCTYYSPAQQQQQQQQQPIPLRRPKAAIPILPPPENQNSRGRNRQSQQDQHQHEQMIQQQQQQEQMVQQQLQQHQQQLIQQQQQELQQQEKEKLKQHQQQEKHEVKLPGSDSRTESDEKTTYDSRSSKSVVINTECNLEEKLKNVTLNEQSEKVDGGKIQNSTELGEIVQKEKEMLNNQAVAVDVADEKVGNLVTHKMGTNQETTVAGDKSESDCGVEDSAVINKTAA